MDYAESVGKVDSIAYTVNQIDFNILPKLESDLEPHELISLVFLLYDEPHVALEKIKLLEIICNSTSKHNTGMDLLLNWALHVQSTKPMWRYELLEALSICQLYSNIKKLDFDIAEIKKYFVPDNIHVNVYIHPIKKILFKLCEQLTQEELQKFKCSIDTSDLQCDCESNLAEVIFLQLISKQFIKLGLWNTNNKFHNNISNCSVSEIAGILNKIHYDDFSKELLNIENDLNGKSVPFNNLASTSQLNQIDELKALNEEFKLLQEADIPKIKKDASENADTYPITDASDIGIVYIINQVNFHASQESIKLKIEPLSSRFSSEKDKQDIERTFSRFGFTIISDNDLKHYKIKENLKKVIEDKVKDKHSAFVLFILSHGMEGAIFGTDSVPVKVEEIQDTLVASCACKLIEKPKLILIQACQGQEGAEVVRKLVADGPMKVRSIPVKSDLATFWATIRGHASYRDESNGSIFIQILCQFLKKYGSTEHMIDIFTKVIRFLTTNVANYVDENGKQTIQVPFFECNLSKKFYLVPK